MLFVFCPCCSLQYLLLSWENAYFLFQEIEGRCAIGSSVILVSYCIISSGSLVLRRWTIFSFLYFLLVGEKAKEPTEREKSCKRNNCIFSVNTWKKPESNICVQDRIRLRKRDLEQIAARRIPNYWEGSFAKTQKATNTKMKERQKTTAE